jgi:hypothetical protein
MVSAVVVVDRDDAMRAKDLRCLRYAAQANGLQHVCFAETHDMIAATKMKEAVN